MRIVRALGQVPVTGVAGGAAKPAQIGREPRQRASAGLELILVSAHAQSVLSPVRPHCPGCARPPRSLSSGSARKLSDVIEPAGYGSLPLRIYPRFHLSGTLEVTS